MSENDSLLGVYVFENLQMLEQLEGLLLVAEKSERFTEDQVGQIFRILHTVKGSSAMMNFENLAHVSHMMENLFAYIRENPDKEYDHKIVCDLVLNAGDFLREEIEKIRDGGVSDATPEELLQQISDYYNLLTTGEASQGGASSAAPADGQTNADHPAPPFQPASGNKFYRVVVHFEKDCKMENVRAFGILKSLEGKTGRIASIPEDVLAEGSDEAIINDGFIIFFESKEEYDELKATIAGNFFIDSFDFEEIPPADVGDTPLDTRGQRAAQAADDAAASPAQAQQPVNNFMSVRLDKIDKLMDLMGEIVITEATVTKNPEIVNLELDSFHKAARQLRKLTDELQDTVMSITVIPISATFHKMERIVRDIGKKIDKKADLIIIGEDTEMDKNVIDNLSDPLMHIVRNSMDHGIETPDVREAAGKPATGTITLEARNTGGDILITVIDDGKGLNRDVILDKAIEKGVLTKSPDEMTDREVYSLIFAPGFSTKEAVTEFSGRGVGMDVALKNIQKIGGSISVDSVPGQGMTVMMRIPLTLAIIDGMQVSVGGVIYIVPLLTIHDSFKPKPGESFLDPHGNELIMIRGNSHRILRLHELLNIPTELTNYEDGMLLVVESDDENYCLFVDELIGQQQTVIKPIPPYIARNPNWIQGISGSCIMGDGSVSLILDVNALCKMG